MRSAIFLALFTAGVLAIGWLTMELVWAGVPAVCPSGVICKSFRW